MLVLWIKLNLKKSLTLLSGLLRLLSASSAVRRLLPFLTSKRMRRVVTADKISVGFQYLDSDAKEKGVIRYNLVEGYFVVFSWPSSFSALRKAQELVRLLSLAIRIIKCEVCN